MTYRGRWHGDQVTFGFHHDLHADALDTALGTRCCVEELAPMLRLTSADFVQTDGKGHPGLTSWFSRTPDAGVAPGLVEDALAQWRTATRALGLPLHVHYSGIWDGSAGTAHPEWRLLTADGTPANAPFQLPGWPSASGGLMCPRGPYLDKLLIPQLLEMIDRYLAPGGISRRARPLSAGDHPVAE